jgi:hypothetical protein
MEPGQNERGSTRPIGGAQLANPKRSNNAYVNA